LNGKSSASLLSSLTHSSHPPCTEKFRVDLSPSLGPEANTAQHSSSSSSSNGNLLVEVEVISPKFWVLPLSSSQIEKYNFIKEKRSQGFYYHQISVMMNESHFKPQRILKFTPQQV
jgi:hypothetical protein